MGRAKMIRRMGVLLFLLLFFGCKNVSSIKRSAEYVEKHKLDAIDSTQVGQYQYKFSPNPDKQDLELIYNLILYSNSEFEYKPDELHDSLGIFKGVIIKEGNKVFLMKELTKSDFYIIFAELEFCKEKIILHIQGDKEGLVFVRM
jgi:hypothetical protein